MDSSMDLMQYALVGGVAGILISLIPISIYLAGAKKRQAKKEAKKERKLKKKEAKKVKKSQKVQEERNQTPNNIKQAEDQRPKKELIKQPVNQPIKEVVQSPPLKESVNETPKIIDQQTSNLDEIMSELEKRSQKLEEEKKLPPVLTFYREGNAHSDQEKKFIFDGTLTIGRNSGYHTWEIEDDRTLSGNHCKIYARGEELYILDLNSTNGTYVNNQRVRGEMKIVSGDLLRFGQNEYRIQF